MITFYESMRNRRSFWLLITLIYIAHHLLNTLLLLQCIYSVLVKFFCFINPSSFSSRILLFSFNGHLQGSSLSYALLWVYMYSFYLFNIFIPKKLETRHFSLHWPQTSVYRERYLACGQHYVNFDRISKSGNRIPFHSTK